MQSKELLGPVSSDAVQLVLNIRGVEWWHTESDNKEYYPKAKNVGFRPIVIESSSYDFRRHVAL
jgi:hypothetical protein